MPTKATKRQRREQAAQNRELLAAANEENALLREQLVQTRFKPATNAAPIFRPQTAVWDWRCQCGRLVYGGKPTCLCRSSRAYGQTIPGSVRGVMQSSRTAHKAIERQRQVPGMASGRQVGVDVQRTSAAPAPSRSIHQRPTSGESGHASSSNAEPYAEVARRAAAPVQRPLAPVGPAESAAAPAVAEAVRLLDQSLQERLAEDDAIDGEDDIDNTVTIVPEDLGPKQLQQRSLNLERKRERRCNQLSRKQEAIVQQKNYIAEQEAKLVEL